MSHQRILTSYIGAFVDELARAGVEDVVVSPGSRSTPITMLVAEHPAIKEWLNLDERSAAFFALGLAKAKQKPVALLCTSGTAVANFFPAIIEAHYSRVPLVVITADRPHELREVGAPQAIDQLKIYGEYAKWFVDMPLPNDSDQMLRYVRTQAGRAVATAEASPSGPVHLNFPLQEPLVPDLDMPGLWDKGRTERRRQVDFYEGKLALEPGVAEKLALELQNTKKGLIVAGPYNGQDFTEELLKLNEKLRYPIIADPLSQLRTGAFNHEWIIDTYDAFLRDQALLERLEPELIIRFGAMPVSKPFLQFLQKLPDCRLLVVEEGSGFREPTQHQVEMIYAHPTMLCQQLAAKLVLSQTDENWVQSWLKVNAAARQVMTKHLIDGPFFEGQVISEIQNLVSEQTAVFVGNSMPVRDLDSFLFNDQKKIRTLANRGANGIDGVVSSALGAAVASNPLILVIGDLSFYHDMNGLMAARYHQLNAKIVVINNNGGGIFSFLPQAESGRHFETLFGTPTELDISLIAKVYNASFHQVRDRQSFRQAFQNILAKKGLDIIEVITDRKENTARHREIWNAVSDQLRLENEK